MSASAIVRPEIGNREKHQGKHGKYPQKLGNMKKHMKKLGKQVGNCHEADY